MICILALVVFGIMGLFSATHRTIAKEAFDCVFRRITLRPCTSGFDQKMKGKIVGKLINKSPKAARFVNKRFELLSWIMVAIFFISMAYSAIGGYNYYIYGNCNGPNEEGFCIFDPLGGNSKISGAQNEELCLSEPPNPKQLSLENIDLSLFSTYNRDAENTVVFIGCYSCPYTREAYPDIKKLADNDDVNFVFAHLEVKESTYYISNILNCINNIDEQKFIEFNDELFNLESTTLKDENEILKVIEKLGFDKDAVKECSYLNETIALSAKQALEIQKTGVYGTPTLFVNGEAVVGPKPYRVYSRLLN
jgi:protein-disulfide isomerase